MLVTGYTYRTFIKIFVWKSPVGIQIADSCFENRYHMTCWDVVFAVKKFFINSINWNLDIWETVPLWEYIVCC